jgi:predicted glycosyltransferase
MGVPSFSFFRGTSGKVDEALAEAGKLTMVTTPDEVAAKMAVTVRKGAAVQPDPGPLVDFICSAIEGAAG